MCSAAFCATWRCLLRPSVVLLGLRSGGRYGRELILEVAYDAAALAIKQSREAQGAEP